MSQKLNGRNTVPNNAHIKELQEAIERSDEWQRCAAELEERLRLRGLFTGLFAAEEIALAEFERLKGETK